jgi:ATP/maltotriose-dependent transcriptional regulator MalT
LDESLTALIVRARHAEAAVLAGRPEVAAGAISKTEALATRAGSGYYLAKAQHLRAQLLAMQGAWSQAEDEYRQVILNLQAQGSRLELGRALLSLGIAQAHHGQQATARASLQQGRQILEECGAHYWVGRAQKALDELDASLPSAADGGC